MAKPTKRTFKPKKALSGVRTEFRAWNNWDEGDILIAKLIGSSQNKKNKSKKDWIVEVIDATFSSRSEAKKLIGKRLTLNTAGMLDKGMEQIDEGDVVQITYNGKEEMQGGDYSGQEAHQMEVILCEEEDEDSEDIDTDDDFDEDEEEEEEEVKPKSKAKSKSRKIEDEDEDEEDEDEYF